MTRNARQSRPQRAASDVTDYAKLLTNDDSDRIETQNNNDRLGNLKYIAPMIDAFKAKVSMTIIDDHRRSSSTAMTVTSRTARSGSATGPISATHR